MKTIKTSKKNFTSNPFLEWEGRNLVIAKNHFGVVWVNFLLIVGFEFLGQKTEDSVKIDLRNNVEILSRRKGAFPNELKKYFNLTY